MYTTSGTPLYKRNRTAAWWLRSPGLAGAMLMLLVGGCTSAAVAPTTGGAPQAAVAVPNPAAPKPADATLKISSPKVGEVFAVGAVKISIDYSGPTLVPGAEAKKLDDYHLHYFLDEDATQYVGAPKPIPTGNPKIVHSAAKEVTFDNVAAGSHTVAVVMSGNNHMSVTPALSDTVKFTVH